MTEETRSLVVLSGGQDSGTILFKAQKETQLLATVFFDYGQRHAVEQECAQQLSKMAKVPMYKLSLREPLGALGNSALLQPLLDVGGAHPTLQHLPASFVPGRNILFLTLASALAMKLGATEVWTGVNATDYSGYPDCRPAFITAMEQALQLGLDFPELKIVAPLLHLSKKQTWQMAQDLGVLNIIRWETHTCYNGDRTHEHPWGYGCGECPACKIRAKGWEEFADANTDY